jgi:hypothetical protein
VFWDQDEEIRVIDRTKAVTLILVRVIEGFRFQFNSLPEKTGPSGYCFSCLPKKFEIVDISPSMHGI